jgi:hypothetical protein
MLGNEADAAGSYPSLSPASYSAGANNGAWVDVRQVQGDLLASISCGARTGSVAYKLQDATDGSGTGAADIAGITLADIGANAAGKLPPISAGATRGFVRVVATVTTGPAICGGVIHGRPASV